MGASHEPSKGNHGTVGKNGDDASLRPILVPCKLAQRIQSFVLDKSSGNIQLNIRQGVILGIHITEIHTA